MKKTLSCVGLVLVLTVFGFVQTAAAFERGPKENRGAGGPQQSHGEHSSGEKSKPGFREDRGRQEVRFQQPAHHYERRLPAGYHTLKIANMILYYLNGIFYQSTPYGYQVVTAPMDAIVRDLPPGYYQILYGGTTYFVYNNVCYLRGPMGYTMVTPPQGVMFPVQTGW